MTIALIEYITEQLEEGWKHWKRISKCH
jgi:hypothetical protein